MTLSEVEEPTNTNYWFLYIAKARTGRFYVGITTNPIERIVEHNSGNGSRFAQQQGPFKLVYVSVPFASKSEARKREIQVKGWTREKKLKLINGGYK
jgi:putative endonuclease